MQVLFDMEGEASQKRLDYLNNLIQAIEFELTKAKKRRISILREIENIEILLPEFKKYKNVEGKFTAFKNEVENKLNDLKLKIVETEPDIKLEKLKRLRLRGQTLICRRDFASVLSSRLKQYSGNSAESDW